MGKSTHLPGSEYHLVLGGLPDFQPFWLQSQVCPGGQRILPYPAVQLYLEHVTGMWNLRAVEWFSERWSTLLHRYPWSLPASLNHGHNASLWGCQWRQSIDRSEHLYGCDGTVVAGASHGFQKNRKGLVSLPGCSWRSPGRSHGNRECRVGPFDSLCRVGIGCLDRPHPK